MPAELLRVLQIEDIESDAALIVRVLEQSGYTVQSERVESAGPMREAIVRHEWDVVIADYQLPEFDAAGALRIRNQCAPDVPFIVVSGTIGEDRAVEMMRAGAQDYVLKDRIARLAPVVQRETQEARSRLERRREYRRVEDRLRDRDEWLALAIDATKLGTFDFQPRLGKLVLSEASCRHFGLPDDAEVSYETVAGSLHPDDRLRVEALIRKALNPQGSGEYTADCRVLGLMAGVVRWLTIEGKVLFDTEGTPVRFVGVTIDITQRKQLEEQLRQNQKLEGIGLLAGGIAHDFNNLLQVISGFTEITLEGLPPHHSSRSDLEQVVKAATQATDLTRQLLAFSRRQPSRTETVSLNDLVKGIRKMLDRLIRKDVKLVVRLGPTALSIRVDPGHIDQVIMNLAVNAADAMPNGGQLVIETSSIVVAESLVDSPLGLAPGQYLTLTVSDTGTGMSPEVKARIFEPFFTTKEPGKGTGLGLSTVYGIAKQSGGTVAVSSEPGQGTTFIVYLPAFAVEATKPVSVVVDSMSTGTETILVAASNAGVRSFVRASLKQHGYRVLECSDGTEAIQQARNHPEPIHLLLRDVVLTGLNGPELTLQLASCRPGLPVLYMSGYRESVSPETGANEMFLQKPFTPKSLLRRVRTMLD